MSIVKVGSTIFNTKHIAALGAAEYKNIGSGGAKVPAFTIYYNGTSINMVWDTIEVAEQKRFSLEKLLPGTFGKIITI